ncbi:hypothetical protein CYMTET_18536 [Cymbomonas tetramitiformis]|uniref:Uncharacterized protein n=1 Tax=Cymbomonas tetramitiformis TaxID=36881 RepID=A0AAE0L5S9_9CHLO|nr:hypothetical protein CYMTET_18536 [Cymbomonas tetramitiformis]
MAYRGSSGSDRTAVAGGLRSAPTVALQLVSSSVHDCAMVTPVQPSVVSPESVAGQLVRRVGSGDSGGDGYGGGEGEAWLLERRVGVGVVEESGVGVEEEEGRRGGGRGAEGGGGAEEGRREGGGGGGGEAEAEEVEVGRRSGGGGGGGKEEVERAGGGVL